MELEIISDTKNTVVNRREIEFYIVEEDKTPSKKEVGQAICKKLNLSPEATIVVRIDQSYGARQGRGVAHSYPSAEAMKRFERGFLFERVVKKEKKASGIASEPKPEKKEEVKEAKEEK